MAYFLKQTPRNGKVYLAIYESFYNHEKKNTAHKSFKSLGTIDKLIEQGIEDPITFYQNEVNELNDRRANEGVKKISDRSPKVYIGHFLLSSVMNKLNIKKYIDYFKLRKSFRFELYDLLASLIYCRVIKPCSKLKTYVDVLPYLYGSYDYSYDQLLDGLYFFGENYKKIVEIFTTEVQKIYGLETSKTYFDCTNFYFEIDREDDFRKKGPSKELRKDPLVGLGLLLDNNLIPIGMEMYPGNESEKPIIRNVIDNLKKQSNITGRTIHVADKGINCASNIAFSKVNGDGYLFSKSVKQLPKVEQEWILLENDYQAVTDENGVVKYLYKSCIEKFPYRIDYEGTEKIVEITEKRLVTYNPSLATKKKEEIYKMIEKAKSLSLSQSKKKEYGESSKYVNFTDGKGGKASVSINQEAIDKDLRLAGYNLLITSETNMSDVDIYSTYHQLWRIEESFRIMKSELDARPVFMKTENTIIGHFLICYLSVLLIRILEFKELEGKFSSSAILRFIKTFEVIKLDSNYVNISVISPLSNFLRNTTNLPVDNYHLSSTNLKKFFTYSL